MIKDSSNISANLSQNDKRVMVQCRTEVKRDAIRRESINGVEHIVVSSSTLPDDIVMNGGLYPANEIASSFQTLELTLAPIEHPSVDGAFISANDPRAIHAFHAGAFNMNVRQENGRVKIDKYINVAEALKTDRGKRLLDRIDELENNESARPIHTSVGVFLSPEEVEGPMVNASGQEYTWIARDMMFDHDAILLDSVGAAQPSQGVGVAVNSKGEELKVHQALVTIDADDIGEMSHSDIESALNEAIKKPPMTGDIVSDVIGDRVIFWSNDQLFSATFALDGRIARIVDIPVPVNRDVTYIPKTNKTEGEAMKDLILNALKESGVETEGLSDTQLFDAYTGLKANQSESDEKTATDDNGLAEIVANAVKPLADKIAGLESKMNEAGEKEVDTLAALVANSGKYPALDADSAKLLGVDKLKEMAANCAPAYGVSPVINKAKAGSEFSAPTDMPE